MNDILKQRLVGALILLALGVVFWPIIFVEPTEGPGGEGGRIPPQPSVDTRPIEPPDLAGLRPSREIERAKEAPAVKAAKQPAPVKVEEAKPVAAPTPASPPPAEKTEAQSRTRSEAPVRPAVDGDGVPIAWILRVASVSNAEKAEALRKDLLAIDIKAYVKKVKRGDRVLYRVYIGPRFEKAPLEKMRGTVDSRFGVTSMITRYYP